MNAEEKFSRRGAGKSRRNAVALLVGPTPGDPTAFGGLPRTAGGGSPQRADPLGVLGNPNSH